MLESSIPDRWNRKDVRETVDEHHDCNVGSCDPVNVLGHSTLNKEHTAEEHEYDDEDLDEIAVLFLQVVVTLVVLFNLACRIPYMGARVCANGNDESLSAASQDLR